MQRLTTTPFGQRPVTAALMKQADAAARPPEIPHVDKWALFRDLCTARDRFAVSDRDLTVLNALLSFHPGATLSDNAQLVVFPSNAALSDRAHGMAESTLRRHLAALVGAGLIQRHDSPNGKRYAARGRDGSVIRAFGLDLRPLLVRAGQIAREADAARDARAALRALREEVSLMKRDAVKLVGYGQDAGLPGGWELARARLLDLHKQMRRNLTIQTLEELKQTLTRLLSQVRDWLMTEEMGGSDAGNGRHHTNSNTDVSESEPADEIHQGETGGTPAPADPPSEPSIPLPLVLRACPDIAGYARHPVHNWHELVALAGFVRPMLGISADAWDDAQSVMGPRIAAITVAAILQRVDDIRSPGGYLRALTRKAAGGGFSPGPMVMALLRPPAAAA